MALAKELGDSEHAPAMIAPLDKSGNPATVQPGSTVWAVSDTTLASIVPDPAAPDTQAIVTDLGPLGEYDVTVSADADLGDGITTITDSLHIVVKAGPAANLGLSLGAPVAN